MIPDAELPPLADSGESPRLRQVGFRIENSAGKPVAGAQVQLIVETTRKRSGKVERVAQMDRGKPAGDGWVLAMVNQSAGTDPVELTSPCTAR